MNLRKVKINDWEEVIRLTDRVFKPKDSMVNAFPLIFNKNNKHSYVVVSRGKIISFVGVVPIQYNNDFGVSIGAVCTDPEHQGQGVLGTYFPQILNELSKEIDFVLISGVGRLYTNNGAKVFGEFYKHTINNFKENSLEFEIYKGSLSQLSIIKTLLDKEETKYNFGVNELDILLDSKGYSKIINHNQETYIAKDKSAFLVLATKDNTGRVLEYAGDITTIIKILETISLSKKIEEIELVLDYKLDKHESIKIPNNGSVINFSESKKNHVKKLPYAAGIRFI